MLKSFLNSLRARIVFMSFSCFFIFLFFMAYLLCVSFCPFFQCLNLLQFFSLSPTSILHFEYLFVGFWTRLWARIKIAYFKLFGDMGTFSMFHKNLLGYFWELFNTKQFTLKILICKFSSIQCFLLNVNCDNRYLLEQISNHTVRTKVWV